MSSSPIITCQAKRFRPPLRSSIPIATTIVFVALLTLVGFVGAGRVGGIAYRLRMNEHGDFGGLELEIAGLETQTPA